MIDSREQQLIDYLNEAGECSFKENFDGVVVTFSYATLKRIFKD